MELPGLVQFRLCTLSDRELAEAVAEQLKKMYEPTVSVPTRHIPARPNQDFDLLVAELIVRFIKSIEKPE
jgi:hypothetical protein